MRGVGVDLSAAGYVEIVGKAEANGSVTYVDHGLLGPTFDLGNYDQLVRIVQSPGYAKLMMS